MKRICSKCEMGKEVSQFHKSLTDKSGLLAWCKECKSEYDKAYGKRRYLKNKEDMLLKQKDYRDNNKDKRRANIRRYQASKLNRTPAWADKWAIEQFYVAAQIFSKRFDIELHVDHIIPLQGIKVSGLHVENNLQIITKEENLSKGNSYSLW